ncbi:hypothetical protein NXY56_006416 [Leishmania guyanensis]
MVKWIRDAGVHCVSCVKRSVRLLVLEGAEWQRDHHAELRALQRERAWRCFIQRYSGFVSAYWAALGVLSVLLWNFKSCGRHPRSFQVKRAVSTLTDTGHQHSSSPAEPPPFVERAAEKSCARQVLRQPGITHPRIAVLTGVRGRGRNSLLRLVVRKEHTAALFVEVRGGEATLSCTVKAMKMPNLECCGTTGGPLPTPSPRRRRSTASAPSGLSHCERGASCRGCTTSPPRSPLIAGCATSPTKLPWSR